MSVYGRISDGQIRRLSRCESLESSENTWGYLLNRGKSVGSIRLSQSQQAEKSQSANIG